MLCKDLALAIDLVISINLPSRLIALALGLELEQELVAGTSLALAIALALSLGLIGLLGCGYD